MLSVARSIAQAGLRSRPAILSMESGDADHGLIGGYSSGGARKYSLTSGSSVLPVARTCS
jgi:hypothetical protein